MGGAEASDRFRLMFERSADAILMLDTATNHFIEYNQAALDMLACSRAELSELHPSHLSPPRQPDGRESYEKANEMIATAVAKGSHRFEWVHRSPHRADFPVEVLLTPIQRGDSPVLLVVWRDITERKQAEAALRQAQKLESLGVLASGIAHDFNNLLTVIAANVSVVQQRLDGDGEARELLGQAENAVFKAAELTRQMLAYGGKGAFVVAPVDLSRAVEEISQLLHASISKRIEVVCELGAVPAVMADAAQLHQVVMNLVTNAGEAIGDGDGRITLRTYGRTLDAETIARDFFGYQLAAQHYVALEVTDTGCGMSHEVMGRIFDPFFTTKETGRGLGLSALRGIVRSHKGGLRIRSAPGAGTTFEVVFPATDHAAPEPPRPSSHVSAPGRRVTVLLVDDEVNVRRACRVNLEQLGCAVLEACDGVEGLEVFAQHRAEIDFVLLDLTMPRMGGHEAFLALRKLDPRVRVVVCSGWAESDLAERFAEERPTAFLQKPFRPEELKHLFEVVGLRGPGLG